MEKSDKIANFANCFSSVSNSDCTDVSWLESILSVRDAPASVIVTLMKGVCFVFCTRYIEMRRVTKISYLFMTVFSIFKKRK